MDNNYLGYSIERLAKKNETILEGYLKNTLKKHFYKEILMIKNKKTLINKKNNLKETDLLVPFFPYRADYELFIYPVIEKSIEENIKVTLIIPKIAFSSPNLEHLKNKIQIIFYEDFISKIKTYNRVKKMLKLEYFSNVYKKYNTIDYSSSKVNSIIVNFAFEYCIALEIIENVKPKKVYSIHFVLNPGWLKAISKKSIPIHLIQHGFFNNSLHDFIGSDLVFLWGSHHKKRLKEIDSSINSIIVGNPKIEIIKKNSKIISCNDKLVILFVSSGSTFSNEKFHSGTLEAIKKIKSLNLNIKLIYKLHPSENISSFYKWIKLGILTENEIVYNSDVYNNILCSDIVISITSTVINEAAYFNKFCIRYNIDNNNLGERIDDGILNISSPKSLVEAIRKANGKSEFYLSQVEKQQKRINYMFSSNENIFKDIVSSLKRTN